MLFYEASKASIKLCEYRMNVMGLEEETNYSKFEADDIEVNAIMKDWCAELTNITGMPCSVTEPFNEMVTATRCVLEAAHDKYGSGLRFLPQVARWLRIGGGGTGGAFQIPHLPALSG